MLPTMGRAHSIGFAGAKTECVPLRGQLNSRLRWRRFPLAIYHLTASAGSRAAGSAAGAKHDYIAREGRYEERGRDGERAPGEVRHLESGNMPRWAADRPRSYWEAADAHERANGRLYREIHVALPAELSRARQKELAQQLARDITGRRRLPYTLAIHEGRGSGGSANPHAHLVWSDRGLDGRDRTAETWFRRYNAKAPERGGARKHGDANGPRWLRQVREQWAGRVNQALERDGHGARVDHRTLAVRALEAADAGDMEKAAALAREPNVHLGPAALESVERMAQGREPPRKLEQALRIEERNAKLPGLASEEQHLRGDLERLKSESKRLLFDLGKARHVAALARHGRPVSTYEPDIGFHFVTGRYGRMVMTGSWERARQLMRPAPEPTRPKPPERGPERDSGPSR